jgi:transcriptional regulator with XRE-family HTH domain
MPASRRSRSQQAKAFGEVLRAARARTGLSQEGLALAIGSARVYVGEVERGEKAPGLEFIFKVAKALGTSPSALLRRTESRLARSAKAPR